MTDTRLDVHTLAEDAATGLPPATDLDQCPFVDPLPMYGPVPPPTPAPLTLSQQRRQKLQHRRNMLARAIVDMRRERCERHYLFGWLKKYGDLHKFWTDTLSAERETAHATGIALEVAERERDNAKAALNVEREKREATRQQLSAQGDAMESAWDVLREYNVPEAMTLADGIRWLISDVKTRVAAKTYDTAAAEAQANQQA